MPEKPPRNLPGSVINELNKAYWVAVNEALVMLLSQAMRATLAMPPLRLSALTTTARVTMSGGYWASRTNSKLVAAVMMAPSSRIFRTP